MTSVSIDYFHGGDSVPSVRFRRKFFDLLVQRGHPCRWLPSRPSRYDHYPWLGWRMSRRFKEWNRRWQCRGLQSQDDRVAVVETGIFHEEDFGVESMIRRRVRRMVYEIDDAVFLLFPDKIQAIAEMVDHVIVGNEAIAQWIRPHNQSVSIIPTCVDWDEYRQETPLSKTEASRHHQPVVGWIGSRGNVRMISVCAPALREVAKKRKLEFRIITSDPAVIEEVDLRGVDVRWVDIENCDVVSELRQFDIGLMPLPGDDPWMKYKCNAKMIQYMAAGVPAVASGLGYNLELVHHGVNSMLANTVSEWTESLVSLLDAPDLRTEMGQAGRAHVSENYSVQGRIDQYEQAILGLPQDTAKTA